MSLEALALETMIAATGPIRQVRPFGDDPFEPELARMLQRDWPVHIEMLAKANGRAGRQDGEELLQQVFTVLENHFCQIEPSTVKNIEDEVAEPVQATGFQIGLQIIEARNAARILDHDSPSISAEPRPSAFNASAMLRKRSVQSSFLRVSSWILRPSIRACMR